VKIRVILAEDQSLVLGALAALLGLENDIEVVATAADGASALRLVAEHTPDVLVTDIEMPVMTGIELAAAVRRDYPKTRVAIVTTFARPGYLRRALDAGVTGYLLKDAPASELAEAIRRVNMGLRVIEPTLAVDAWTERDPLSDRERAVLKLAGDGSSSHEIANKLGLTDGTVRNYLSEAIGKLGAANRVDAARIARERGWL
jgi:two-component system response regulator DesR